MEPERGSPAWWDTRYLSGDIPWHTGIVPPEVERLISFYSAFSLSWLGERRAQGPKTVFRARLAEKVARLTYPAEAWG